MLIIIVLRIFVSVTGEIVHTETINLGSRSTDVETVVIYRSDILSKTHPHILVKLPRGKFHKNFATII